MATSDGLFGVLYAEHSSLVRRVVRSIAPNPADVEDICQDVWLRISQSLESSYSLGGAPTPIANPAAYLAAMAKNSALEYFRKRTRDKRDRRKEEPLDPDRPIADTGASPDQLLAEQQRRKKYLELFPAGPMRDTLDFLLQGYTNKEIAELRGVAPSTVRAQVCNLRQMIRTAEQAPSHGGELPERGSPGPPQRRSRRRSKLRDGPTPPD